MFSERLLNEFRGETLLGVDDQGSRDGYKLISREVIRKWCHQGIKTGNQILNRQGKWFSGFPFEYLSVLD